MILKTAVLCAIEAAIVLWLALEVFGAEPQPTAGEGAALPVAPSGEAMPVAAGTGAAPESLAVASANLPPIGDRAEVAAKWRADDPVGVLLTGTVKLRDGNPAEGVSLSIEIDGESCYASTAANGSYALLGLQPGTWACVLSGTSVAETTVDVDLGDEAVQRRDFVVDASIPLRVLIVTADGTDGTRALRTAMPEWGEFMVAAQAASFPERLAPTDYGAVFVGDAQWRSERNPQDGFAGTLHCKSLPAHVALLQRHLVLQQQLVQPGATEVKFVVDVEALRALAGSATVRVLDAATGAPIVGTRVALQTSNRGGGGKPTDAEGRVVIDGLSPGLLHCEIQSKDREYFHTTVRIDPGQRLDLGDVRLAAPAPLKGTVLDAEGKAATATLSWCELKWRTAPTAFTSNRQARTEADGSFSLWQTGPGPIAVTAYDADGNIAHGVFDNPPASPIVLRVAKPAKCTVTRPADPTRSFTITLFDGKRRPIAAVKLEPRQKKTAISLEPGAYTFEVHDEQSRLVQSGSVTLGASPTTVEIR